MYATVINHRVKFHEGTPTLEQMQKVVDGYIETADRFPTLRKGITVDIYCNEEGHMIGLPYTYFNQNRAPIAGNLVLVGADERTGDSVQLAHDELWAVLNAIGFFPRDEDIS